MWKQRQQWPHLKGHMLVVDCQKHLSSSDWGRKLTTTHEAGGAHGLLGGQGVLCQGGVSQERPHPRSEVVGLEVRGLDVFHGHI